MSRLVFATLALALLALPGCDLLASAPSATVTVQKSDGSAPACCPMESAGGAAADVGADVAAEAISDCGECPSAAADAAAECQTDEACDMSDCDMSDCDMSDCDDKSDCDMSDCETETKCDKDGGSQQ